MAGAVQVGSGLVTCDLSCGKRLGIGTMVEDRIDTGSEDMRDEDDVAGSQIEIS
jgi:hypothetical protein